MGPSRLCLFIFLFYFIFFYFFFVRVFWLQIAIELFVLFHHSVSDIMCVHCDISMMRYPYADRAYVCTLKLHKNKWLSSTRIKLVKDPQNVCPLTVQRLFFSCSSLCVGGSICVVCFVTVCSFFPSFFVLCGCGISWVSSFIF